MQRWWGPVAAMLTAPVLVGCGPTITDPLAAESPSPTLASTTVAPSTRTLSTPARSAAPPATPTPSNRTPSTATASPSPSVAGDRCEYTRSGTAARPVRLPSTVGVPDSGRVTVRLAMTEGAVTLTLDRAKAPCTVHSFESLARQGFYTNTRCHRLADSRIFVLQCGDPTGTGRGGPGYTFPDETDGTESYRAGVVAMANAGPNTNGSQFFMVYGDSTALDAQPNYTIFGRLDKRSQLVVARMAAEGQDGRYSDGSGVPNNPARIGTVSVSSS